MQVNLVMGHGYYGFRPVPGRSDPDPTTATLVTDSPAIYGTMLGGRVGSTLAILGAGQVDRRGNMNSTLIDGKILTGSGGSNDAASTCDTIVVTRQSARKLVEAVEYVTCAGERVCAVVTERAVFSRSPAGTLVLTHYMDPRGIGAEAVREEIRAGCGWTFECAPDLRAETPPTAAELALIRRLMPSRYE